MGVVAVDAPEIGTIHIRPISGFWDMLGVRVGVGGILDPKRYEWTALVASIYYNPAPNIVYLALLMKEKLPPELRRIPLKHIGVGNVVHPDVFNEVCKHSAELIQSSSLLPLGKFSFFLVADADHIHRPVKRVTLLLQNGSSIRIDASNVPLMEILPDLVDIVREICAQEVMGKPS